MFRNNLVFAIVNHSQLGLIFKDKDGAYPKVESVDTSSLVRKYLIRMKVTDSGKH